MGLTKRTGGLCFDSGTEKWPVDVLYYPLCLILWYLLLSVRSGTSNVIHWRLDLSPSISPPHVGEHMGSVDCRFYLFH